MEFRFYEFLDSENVGVAVEILILRSLQREI